MVVTSDEGDKRSKTEAMPSVSSLQCMILVGLEVRYRQSQHRFWLTATAVPFIGTGGHDSVAEHILLVIRLVMYGVGSRDDSLDRMRGMGDSITTDGLARGNRSHIDKLCNQE